MQLKSRKKITYCNDKGDYEAMRRELRNIYCTSELKTRRESTYQQEIAIYQRNRTGFPLFQSDKIP